MSEIAVDLWYKEEDIEVSKSQSVDVRESGEVVQVTVSEFPRHEPSIPVRRLVHLDFFYEGRETQLVELG